MHEFDRFDVLHMYVINCILMIKLSCCGKYVWCYDSGM